MILLLSLLAVQDSLPPLQDGRAPRTVEELWAGYDPRTEKLDVKVVREWTEGPLTLRYVTYHIGTFKGTPARMAAFYGFPTGEKGLPGVLQVHGGGQRASLREVRRYAARGYGCLSVNWGGREMEGAKPGDENTDWGAVDPTQKNVPGYFTVLPGPKTIDTVESPRNNNWFLLTLANRRGLTFLERRPEVDDDRLGVVGHSMGGRQTGMIAGCDPRLKVASPSVGGAGFKQEDLWGMPGTARRINGSVDLFRATLAGEAYLARAKCPLLFLSATNDFNAPMDRVFRGMKLVPHDRKRVVIAPHLNHRFTPETEISRPLWLDHHLQGGAPFPKTPAVELVLGPTPLFRVTPDATQPVDRVDLYYGYDRDPRNRFWADGRAVRKGDTWEAACPVFDAGEPLFAYANVYYRIANRREGDPERFAISAYAAAYPGALQKAGVKTTGKRELLIDDFSRGWTDGYVLAAQNPHHWHFATRKIVDPRWRGRKGDRLAFEVETTEPGNALGVIAVVDAWRGHLGKRRQEFVAVVRLANPGRHPVILSPSDFHEVTNARAPMASWEGITELGFRSADKVLDDATLRRWMGKQPAFRSLRWLPERP